MEINSIIKNQINNTCNNKIVTFKSKPNYQDKVEISSKKRELSTETKVGIGLGILTIIGVGIYKKKSLKNLREKIFGKGNKKTPKEPNEPPKPTKKTNAPKLEENTPFNDIKDFGTKLADGTIRFKTEQGAIDYARKTICEALQGTKDKQKEVAIAIKGNTILGIAEGSYNHVNHTTINGVKNLLGDDICSNVNRDIILLHGHPDYFGKGKTFPLSYDDVNMLRRFNFKSVIAYNSKGEYNKLEINKVTDFATQKVSDFKYFELFSKYVSKKVLSSQEYKRLWQIDKIIKEYKKNKIKIPADLSREHDDLLRKLDNLTNKYEKTEDYAKMLHEMYINETESTGLRYSTNFSNL